MMTALASLSLSPGISFTWTGQEELIRWKKGETTLSLSPQESQIWPIWKVKENQSLVTRPNHNKQTKHHLKRARETSDQVKPVIWNDRAITAIMSLSPLQQSQHKHSFVKDDSPSMHHCHLRRVWETSDQASKIWPGKAPDMKGYNLLSLSCRFHLTRETLLWRWQPWHHPAGTTWTVPSLSPT